MTEEERAARMQAGADRATALSRKIQSVVYEYSASLDHLPMADWGATLTSAMSSAHGNILGFVAAKAINPTGYIDKMLEVILADIERYALVSIEVHSAAGHA